MRLLNWTSLFTEHHSAAIRWFWMLNHVGWGCCCGSKVCICLPILRHSGPISEGQAAGSWTYSIWERERCDDYSGMNLQWSIMDTDWNVAGTGQKQKMESCSVFSSSKTCIIYPLTNQTLRYSTELEDGKIETRNPYSWWSKPWFPVDYPVKTSPLNILPPIPMDQHEGPSYKTLNQGRF